ncbi:MAG: alanine racemase [Thermoguttaceae bacterium]
MSVSSGHSVNRKVIGWPVEDLVTPALLLDGAIADRNIRRMADFFRNRLCRLRPQFKNHCCPELARHQVKVGGTSGIACATLSEAEALAKHGFPDIVLANEVVGRQKIARLVELARKVELRVAVDDLQQAVAISEAASAAKATLGVAIDLDAGAGRSGVAPGKAALELARGIDGLPRLRIVGIQVHEGETAYITDFERRAEIARQAVQLALETRRKIEDDGIPLNIISVGSSATYQICGAMDGVDEIQAGTYATMDWRYAQLSPEFDVALTVLARVVTKRPCVAVLDAGMKDIGCDMGPPRVKDCPQANLPTPLAEDICLVHASPAWRVGDAVQLIPGHACTTCRLYREIYIHEDGRVIEVWPIVA